MNTSQRFLAAETCPKGHYFSNKSKNRQALAHTPLLPSAGGSPQPPFTVNDRKYASPTPTEISGCYRCLV